MYISTTEAWEMDYYIPHYLRENGFHDTPANAKIVADALDRYPGRSPFKRTEVTSWLNSQFKK